MTPDAADARYVRLNRALHDLATAIDTVEHAGDLIDPGHLHKWVRNFTAGTRLTVTHIQRELEHEVTRT